jgi:hypothetical protein
VKAAKAPAIHMSELLLREAAFLDVLSSESEGEEDVVVVLDLLSLVSEGGGIVSFFAVWGAGSL